MEGCAICGQTAVVNLNGLFYCKNCSIVYSTKKYSYSSDFFKDFAKENFIIQRQKVFEDFFLNIGRNKALGKNLEVLDIGCATGSFISYCLGKTSWKLTGIDIAEDAIAAAKAKLSDSAAFFVSNIEDFSARSDKKFDLIFSSHTLEHVNNPRAYIKGAFNALKPGGLLYLEIPNERTCFMNLYKNKFSRKKIYDNYLNHAYGHVFFYNPKSIRNLLNDFSEVNIKFSQWPLISIGKNWKIYTTEYLKKFLFFLFPYLRISDRIIIIAKKCAE